jgi:hypothetical protein
MNLLESFDPGDAVTARVLVRLVQTSFLIVLAALVFASGAPSLSVSRWYCPLENAMILFF